MFLGEYRKIRFEYTDVSIQAVLDKIPIAKTIDEIERRKIIEAETFGIGVNMFLLSQERG